MRGGNTFGVIRAFNESWGFNPIRFGGQRSYFMMPAGTSSLRVALFSGAVSLGFVDGELIAAEIIGSDALKKQPQEFKFAPADKPRMAYVQWAEAGNIPSSQGLVLEGVTMYSPDASYVLYESLD